MGKYLLSGTMQFKEVKVDNISLHSGCFWKNHNLCSIYPTKRDPTRENLEEYCKKISKSESKEKVKERIQHTEKKRRKNLRRKFSC